MKNLFTTLLLSVVFHLNAQTVEIPKLSQFQKIEQRIGLTDIAVAYSRPLMKGRIIFGGLVPYEKMWRTGANSNTIFSVSTPVSVKGNTLNTGSYALYTKPGEDNWDIYFYKTTDNWGTPDSWDDDNVALKITVPVHKLNTAVEVFTISMDAISTESVDIGLRWEKTHVVIPVKIDIDSTVPGKIEEALKGPKAYDYYSAADYYYESGRDLAQAKIWIDMAVKKAKASPFFLYNTKQALIYYALGHKKEAIKKATLALELSKKAGSKWGINMNENMLKEWSE